MSYLNWARAGIDAAEKRDWDTAINKLTLALSESLNPKWLLARAKALTAVSRFSEALADADLAWHEANRRSNRELIIDAQYRRGVIYNRLGELANADCCCFYAETMLNGGKTVAPQDPAEAFEKDGKWAVRLEDVKAEAVEREAAHSASTGGAMKGMQESSDKIKTMRLVNVLRQQILHKLDQLPEDDPARKRTCTQKPPVRDLDKLGIDKSHGKEKESSTSAVSIQNETTAGKSASSTPAASKAAPESAAPSDTAAAIPKPAAKDEDLRIQDFQSSTTASVTILSKGNDKEKLKVSFQPFGISLENIVFPDGTLRGKVLAPWGEIVPEKCTYTVTKSKVELKLEKSTAGKWPTLWYEGSADEGLARNSNRTEGSASTSTADAETETSSSKPTGPAYPTSSRTGPKDWDKLDAGSDDEDGDVNSFFKKLYKGASAEQQRAMMKSFTESSGTSLSTDWSDVGSRKVEAVPPEGVEAKDW